ncbi:hypothetical protein [Paraburkholderia xenovorans]
MTRLYTIALSEATGRAAALFSAVKKGFFKSSFLGLHRKVSAT